MSRKPNFDFANFKFPESKKERFKFKLLLYIPLALGVIIFFKLVLVASFLISFRYLGKGLLGAVGGWVLLIGSGCLLSLFSRPVGFIYNKVINWLES